MKLTTGLAVSLRCLTVWQRNWTVYLRTWKVDFLPPMLEPLFYVAAFGVGFKALVGSVRYGGAEVSYIAFIAPALIAVSVMYNAFFENTYTSFVRMYYQKTFDAMLATPLSLDEVITGEIVWGATRAVLATAIMLVILSLFGLIRWPEGLLILPLSLLGGLAFGAIGMVFTGIVPAIDTFNLPVFLLITPMFLFSGTFFPLDALPRWAQYVALIFPLTHLAALTRGLAMGGVALAAALGSCAYLVAFTTLFYLLALKTMRRRLIH